LEPEKLAIQGQYQIAAYITAYEDPEAVKRCLHAINRQSFPIQKILIVDNSRQKLVAYQGDDFENVIVKSHPENIGVSGGLSLAFTWAIHGGYDFLWTFDQDSVVEDDCLTELLLAYESLNSSEYLIGIIGPTAIDPRSKQIIEGAVFEDGCFRGRKPPNTEQPYECDSPITSGSLTSLRAAQTVSVPCIDLFIDGIDLDYGLRLKQEGFHNLIVPKAKMYHNFGEPMPVKVLGRERLIHNYSPLRYYYILRNHTYLDIHYSKGWYRFINYWRRVHYSVRTIALIVLCIPEDKALKVWACLLGLIHGFQRKLGKTW
jgi:rhamnosyltransferase